LKQIENEHINPIEDPQILKEFRENDGPIGEEDRLQNDLDEQIERMDKRKLLYIKEEDDKIIIKTMIENKGKVNNQIIILYILLI
jgi:hypothetical protein